MHHVDISATLRNAPPEAVRALLPRRHFAHVAAWRRADRPDVQGVTALSPLIGEHLPEGYYPCRNCGLPPAEHVGWVQGHMWVRRAFQ